MNLACDGRWPSSYGKSRNKVFEDWQARVGRSATQPRSSGTAAAAFSGLYSPEIVVMLMQLWGCSIWPVIGSFDSRPSCSWERKATGDRTYEPGGRMATRPRQFAEITQGIVRSFLIYSEAS